MIRNIVFFIQNISRPAGSERVTSLIANNLDQKGYNIQIVSICGDNTCFYPLNSKIKINTLIDRTQVDNKKMFFYVIKKLHQFYKRNEIDLCIDVFPALSIYTLLLKKRHKFKNITWEHFNYKINLGMNRIGRRLAMRYSDQIITLTSTDKKYYLSNSNRIKGNIDYIYNPSPYQNVEIKEKRKSYALSVGRLTYQKGFDRLIKVWEKVESKINLDILILGEGEEFEKLYDIIRTKQLKRIHLLGAVKNIERYYEDASFYVSTARFEGLPMTMIEAQSFGLPIISFDYDTGPEDIITNNSDGYLIKENTEEKKIQVMASKIISLSSDAEKLQQMRKAAQKSSERFTTDAIVKKWESVIGNL